MTNRRRFLRRRRELTRRRFDSLHVRDYDEHWGGVPDSHARWLTRFTEMVVPDAAVLDAACGTGRAWPWLLSTGLRVTGTDQSEEMLAVARGKHPRVPTQRLALQDLVGHEVWTGQFDGLTCLDAMENVGPEDWPVVLSGFASLLRPSAPLYLTVEMPDPAETGDLTAPGEVDGVPLVEGELVSGGGYHFYPRREQVMDWLAGAGFAVVGEEQAEHYWHLLVRSSA